LGFPGFSPELLTNPWQQASPFSQRPPPGLGIKSVASRDAGLEQTAAGGFWNENPAKIHTAGKNFREKRGKHGVSTTLSIVLNFAQKGIPKGTELPRNSHNGVHSCPSCTSSTETSPLPSAKGPAVETSRPEMEPLPALPRQGKFWGQ